MIYNLRLYKIIVLVLFVGQTTIASAADKESVYSDRSVLLFSKNVKVKEKSNYTLSYGQEVTIIFIKKNMLIKAPGICLEPGFVGDIIKVRNVRSKKITRGCIIDKYNVLLETT